MNPDVYMMCDLPATVKALRAEWCLSGVHSHSFPNQRRKLPALFAWYLYD